MHSATVSKSRYATAALVGGAACKKGTAANEVSPIAATTDIPAGIVSNDDVTTANITAGDAAVGVVLAGVTVALAGATVTIDDKVVVAADGRLVPKAGAGWVVGTALTPAAAGEYFEILVNIRKEPA
jgi:hypothetical protein